MEYLGMIIRPGEVQMDPGKVAAVKDWPTPTTLKEVQAFIGFFNFYRRFIKDFSTMARPLHDLNKKDIPWHWSQEQQEAFNAIKKWFCEEPILKVYDPDLPPTLNVTLQDLPQVASSLRSTKTVSGTQLHIAHSQ